MVDGGRGGAMEEVGREGEGSVKGGRERGEGKEKREKKKEKKNLSSENPEFMMRRNFS